jgi:hypothetical protein
MNLKELPIGARIETMLHGFICQVEIVGRHTTVLNATDEDLVYDVKYIGERRCLDLGQNWYINNGDVTWTRPMNIARAAKWRAEGH